MQKMRLQPKDSFYANGGKRISRHLPSLTPTQELWNTFQNFGPEKKVTHPLKFSQSISSATAGDCGLLLYWKQTNLLALSGCNRFLFKQPLRLRLRSSGG